MSLEVRSKTKLEKSNSTISLLIRETTIILEKVDSSKL